jgi:hypothetical protein
MNLLLWPFYEIIWYGLWWLCFVAIAYCSARYLGWFGVFAGAFFVSVLIVAIDVHWIFKDMQEHSENGRDADFVFWFGVLCRIVFFNIVLLPATVIGLRLRARSRRPTHETKVA